MYGSTLSFNSAFYKCERSTSRPAFLPQGKTRYPLYVRVVEAQSQTGRVREISLVPGFNLRTVQAVARRYIGCALPIHN
jgi:hypothetical protein